MKKFSLIALVVLLIGCTNDASQDEQLVDRLPIKINFEKSRANDTAFESGDQVGLYVVNYDGSTAGTLTSGGNYVDNACFTLSTDWRADEELYWKDASTKADFYAYYPYGNPTDVSAYPFSVNTDQSAEADYWASDFLWGKRSGVAPTKSAVTITTEHLLSNALVYIKAGEGYTAEELATADIEVKICNVKNSATINLATGVATAIGNTTEITPWNTGAYYRAMIVPQTVSRDTNLIALIINGQEYTYATDITFAAGTQHKIEITITAPSNGLVANFSIKEWSVDDNIYGGEAIINPGTPMPANNEIWYTSTDGKVVAPYETDVFGANIVSNTYENGKGVIKFDDNVTSIGGYAFGECETLKSITFSDSVTLFGEAAFCECTALVSVEIPNSVTVIGTEAFAGCVLLRDIEIPNSVSSIGIHAFYNCTSLTSVTIPDSVTSIGYSAFHYCPSLTAFYGKYASSDNRCLIINGELNSFAPAGLSEYTIIEGVRSIGREAFAVCRSLTSVTIPYSITSIREYAFVECTSLRSVTIGNGVTLIEDGAFYGCSSLTSATIPNSVTWIGGYAFGGCTSLKDIYCKPSTPPTVGEAMFGYSSEHPDCKIYVPAASVNAYKSKQYWKDYADYIVGYNF